jgi:hypothetical protein
LALFSLFFLFTVGMSSSVKANTSTSSEIRTHAQSNDRMKDMMKTIKINENKVISNKLNKKIDIEIVVTPKQSKAIDREVTVLANSHGAKPKAVAKSRKQAVKNDQLPKNLMEFGQESEMEVVQSWENLSSSLKGAKLDTLIMLIVTSAVIPVFKRLNLSPILGFLLMGTVIGPSCLSLIADVHTIDMLGELGISPSSLASPSLLSSPSSSLS